MSERKPSRLIIMASDKVNLYDQKIALSALAEQLEQVWEGGIPIHLGHDMHRVIGWNFPLGIFMLPGEGQLVGYQIFPEEEGERGALLKAHEGYFAKYHHDHCHEHLPELRRALGHHLTEEGRFLYAGCVSYIQAGLAREIFPELFTDIDEDGLIDIRHLLKECEFIGPGTFKHKESSFCGYLHPYFRKSLSRHNSPCAEFLDGLLTLTRRPELSIRVALDPDMVGLASTYKPHIELEYWRGPKFNDDLTKIPPGVTEHAHPEGLERSISGVFKTQFWWKDNEGARSFEMEEIREVPSMGLPEKGFGLRYIHSFLTDNKQSIAHCDGAIRAYTMEEYEYRKTLPINQAGKASRYTKLFRVDGELTVGEWKHLVANYYQGNTLVLEYFGGLEDFNRSAGIGKGSASRRLTPVERYCPYGMTPEMGVRVFLSLHRRSNETEATTGRSFLVRDFLVVNGEEQKYVEWICLEWAKAIRREGGQCPLPVGCGYVTIEDEYFNIPVLRHGSDTGLAEVQASATALHRLSMCLVGDGRKTVFSTGIVWPYGNSELSLSVMGTASAVAKWLEITGDKWPGLSMRLPEWIEWQTAVVEATGSVRTNKPTADEIAQTTGSLWIRRRPLGDEVEAESHLDDDAGGIWTTLRFRPGHDDLLEAVSTGELGVAVAHVVQAAKCRKCGGDYFTCVHSKFLDPDVYAEISKCVPMGRFWTNRPTRWELSQPSWMGLGT